MNKITQPIIRPIIMSIESYLTDSALALFNNVTALNWPITTSIIPTKADDYTATFARSTKSVVTDNTGKSWELLPDEAGFTGARIELDPSKLFVTFTASATTPSTLKNMSCGFNDGSTFATDYAGVVTRQIASYVNNLGNDIITDGDVLKVYVGDFTGLAYFNSASNQLTGSIPDLSSNVTLNNFQCYSNQLTGSIPDLSSNVSLTTFYCHSNQLTGSIPDLSSNVYLTKIYCNNNQLTSVSPDFAVPAISFTFKAYTNQFPEAEIDKILAAFVLANHTTTTGIIDISGTGNAPPSAAGLADKATLISLGWTVTTN